MAFKLVTLNLNGIRSAVKKGFVEWAQSTNADCMGVQELRAQPEDVTGKVDKLGSLHGHFHFAQKKGYAGVGLYTRHAPSDIVMGIGNPEFDAEGRWVETRFDTPKRRLSIISCYFPSGSISEERQAAKFRFLGHVYPHLMALKAKREFVMLGDVNIAHHEIDLKNWKGNLKNSGFTPEERAWMTKLLTDGGLVDVFRALNSKPDQFTWWSNRGQAWANNVGWRIDYHLATPGMAALARRESIYLDRRFSDHAPLTIDYDFKL